MNKPKETSAQRKRAQLKVCLQEIAQTVQSQKLGHRWLDLEELTQLCQKANIQLD